MTLNTRQPVALAIMGAVALLAAPAYAQSPEPAPGDWSVSLGAGALVAPEYPGSKSFGVTPVPLIDIAYRADLLLIDTIFLNTRDGLGIVALREGPFSIGGSIGLAPGRDEDGTARLRGLGDIDAAARASLFLRADFGAVGLSLRGDSALGDQKGTTITAEASYRQRLADDFMVVGRVAAVWGDEDSMQQWFGIDEVQAARSAIFDAYQAEAGFQSVSLSVTGIYDLSESWKLNATVGITRLLGDAADSPITERENQPFGLLGLSYRF
jgi:outer membrane scaffolding protein for murein synthesis (MipA/OmpV family)